jgi:hypothetical protein
MLTLFQIVLLLNVYLVKGTVVLSVASEESIPHRVIHYCPQTYYYFRCEVSSSLRLVWRVNDIEMLRLGPSSKPSDMFPEEPLNFLVQSVEVGDSPSQTNFVSYLWFNTGNVDWNSVSCESNEETHKIMMEINDTECEDHITDFGNMEMSCSSSQMPSPNVLCYSPGLYYHFRCEVRGSLRQVWKVDGDEMFRLGPSSTTADVFPTEPLNFLVHQVIVGDNPFQTTFVSYLWFNSSNFVPTTVTCESATQNISVTLERYDVECEAQSIPAETLTDEEVSHIADPAKTQAETPGGRVCT